VSVLQRAGQFVEWFTTPGVIPWVGAAAAVAAAITVDSRTWLKSPMTAVGRLVRVALVWLLVVWLLGFAFHKGTGSGRGEAGSGAGEGAGQGDGRREKTAVANVTDGPMPSGTPANAVLVISFVPMAGDPAVAQAFACDLHIPAGNRTGGTKTEIRAPDMPAFDKLLVQHLRGVPVGADGARSEVRIKRTPFPGEPALRRVADKVRIVLPTTTVVFDE